MKQLITTKEEMELNWLLTVLGEYQEEIFKLDREFKEFSFNWENATKEYVEIRNNTELYEWLHPIKFSSELAIIIEMLQEHSESILINRMKVFQLICFKFNMNLQFFNRAMEEIKGLLIEYKKVKICKDGKVIIMNDVW